MNKVSIGLIGLMLGVVATLGYQSVTNSPDIDYVCNSNATKYTCRFFNKGSGSGAMCVVVTLKRDKPTEAYVKPTAPHNIVHGNRMCSGPLSKGEDKAVAGDGFYGEDGRSASAEELCRTKADPASISGCVLDVNVVAHTR
jgi:hypothetical protein